MVVAVQWMEVGSTLSAAMVVVAMGLSVLLRRCHSEHMTCASCRRLCVRDERQMKSGGRMRARPVATKHRVVADIDSTERRALSASE